MKYRLTSLVALAATSLAIPAQAQMGLEPGAPQSGSLPGGVSPGVESQGKDDWRFDFHGYFSMPFWVGFGERENPKEGQSKTTWHAPPVVPGERGSFSYTNVMPDPWTQLNFSYGTSMVRGTVIIAASTAASAEAFYNPPDHIGIQDAFLTLDLPSGESSKYHVNAGVFSNRYGMMGEYDEGYYATPVTARMDGAGFTATGRWLVTPELAVVAEAGAMGNIDKPVLGTNPEGWNDFADANTGSTFAFHGHAGLSYDELVHFGLHGIHTFAQDDQAAVQDQPDASLLVIGTDLRFTMAQFGHLFLGASFAKADTVQALGSVTHYLDTKDGRDLMRNYLGNNSNGTGEIFNLAAQYDFSLASLLTAPEPFSGNAPDLRVSLFGQYTGVDSDDNSSGLPDNRVNICNKECMKFGTELTYKPYRYFAVAFRGDQVFNSLDGDEKGKSFGILTPRMIFSSDWNSQDQIVLQYSRYVYGDKTAVRNPSYDPTGLAYTGGDSGVLSLYATMWW